MSEIEKVKKAQEGCIKTMRELSTAYKGSISTVAVGKFRKWNISVINEDDIRLFIIGHMPEWIMSIPTNTEYTVYTLLHNKMQYALNNELRKYKRHKRRVEGEVNFDMASLFLHDSSNSVNKNFIIEELLDYKTLTPLEKSVVKDIIIDGVSYETTAQRNDVKEKAAKNAYFRAIKKLKEVYKTRIFSL